MQDACGFGTHHTYSAQPSVRGGGVGFRSVHFHLFSRCVWTGLIRGGCSVLLLTSWWHGLIGSSKAAAIWGAGEGSAAPSSNGTKRRRWWRGD